MVHPRPLRRARRAPQPRFPADVTGEEQVSVSVHIVEVLGASSGDPLVDLVATFSRHDKQHVLMELPQARALSRQLARLTALAGPRLPPSCPPGCGTRWPGYERTPAERSSSPRTCLAWPPPSTGPSSAATSSRR
jgi:hypothetical protein